MSDDNVKDGLLYSNDHEWVRMDGDVAVLGITHHAQDALGDVVFLELPEVGAEIKPGIPFGVVESVKAVEDLLGPINGTVAEVNSALVDTPEKVNTEPYDGAWMVKLTPSGPDAIKGLMDAVAYREYLKTQG